MCENGTMSVPTYAYRIVTEKKLRVIVNVTDNRKYKQGGYYLTPRES